MKQENLMTSELILEDMLMIEDNQVATMEKWAKTRRQKILMNISFESKLHNIYDPAYSSAEENSPLL